MTPQARMNNKECPMARTITLTIPDSPADTLAMFQAMFTPAFLAGILAIAQAQGAVLPSLLTPADEEVPHATS